MITDEEFNLYLQFEQNIAIKKQTVKLRDVAAIYCSDAAKSSKIDNLIIAKLSKKEQQKVLSALEIVKIIGSQCPNASVTVFGEDDFILTLSSGKNASLLGELARTALVCLIVFFGAAFSVATFNNDVDISLLFDQTLASLHSPGELLPWLQISYSAGIPLGILIFYNHIFRRKMYNDPTPLEVEMRLYEQEVNTASILNESRKEEEDVHK